MNIQFSNFKHKKKNVYEFLTTKILKNYRHFMNFTEILNLNV